MDFNNDGITGNGIVRTYDASPSGNRGFYKTASNEFIFDQSGMGLGSNTQNPINPVDSRGKNIILNMNLLVLHPSKSWMKMAYFQTKLIFIPVLD